MRQKLPCVSCHARISEIRFSATTTRRQQKRKSNRGVDNGAEDGDDERDNRNPGDEFHRGAPRLAGDESDRHAAHKSRHEAGKVDRDHHQHVEQIGGHQPPGGRAERKLQKGVAGSQAECFLRESRDLARQEDKRNDEGREQERHRGHPRLRLAGRHVQHGAHIRAVKEPGQHPKDGDCNPHRAQIVDDIAERKAVSARNRGTHRNLACHAIPRRTGPSYRIPRRFSNPADRLAPRPPPAGLMRNLNDLLTITEHNDAWSLNSPSRVVTVSIATANGHVDGA